jgi:hypothetical protein
MHVRIVWQRPERRANQICRSAVQRRDDPD